MKITASKANDIQSPPGNSLALYIDADTGSAKIKDINGGVVNLAELVEPITDEFLIFCVRSENGRSRIMYKTDTQRYLDIEQFVDKMYSNAASVIIKGNNVFICYYRVEPDNATEPPMGILKLGGCYKVNNLLVVSNTSYVTLTEMIITSNTRLHGEAFDDGYLYYSSRQTSSLIDTQVFKVNMSNLNDYQVAVPFKGGGIHNIEVYDNYIYFMKDQAIWRMDTNLGPCTKVFDLDVDGVTKVVYNQHPFLIYLDKIIVITNDNSNTPTEINTVGIQVYTMWGELIAENIGLQIAQPEEGYTSYPSAHWLIAFNGYYIFHTASKSAENSPKKVVRIKAETLALEESVNAPAYMITDDNSCTPAGEVYLNNEVSGSTAYYQYVSPYKPFNFQAVGEVGFYAAGSTPPKIPKKSLLTNISQLKNDVEYVDQDQLETAIAGVPTGGSRVAKYVSDTTYSFVSEDRERFLIFTAATPVTVTLDSGLPANGQYEGIQRGAGKVSFVASGTTLNKPSSQNASTALQYATFGINWIESETYVIYGNLELV